jgi:hypothetical protein
MISGAYDTGVESLPLLGPRAGGTMLRLGPAFYNFQYLATQIFQSTDASVLGYPDLFFSILTIPLFFFFSRRYFSSAWSLAMALMLAVSFLAIEYGRFAWNPNSTLFFTLVFSYALLRLYDTESGKQRPLWWAFVAGIGLAIASQLHFSAFLGLPIALIAFIFFNFRDSKKVLSFKVISIFLLSVFLIYLPVLLSEFFKHGENFRLFFSAIGIKAASHGIFQNIFQVLRMFSKYFARISFGLVDPGRIVLFLSGIFFASGFLANVLLLRLEKDAAKRKFLQWTLILIVVYFVLYIPLAFKINRPRFYLPFMMLPYVYLGYIVIFFRERFKQYLRLVVIFAFLGLSTIVFGNVYATTKWFSELQNSEHTITSTGEKNSKGTSFFMTWGHFERAARVIDESCETQGTIYFAMAKGVAEFDHSVEYALQQRRLRWTTDEKGMGSVGERKGCYYFLSFPREPLPEFVVLSRQDAAVDVGNLQIVRLYPEGALLDEFNDDKITVEREVEKNIFVPEKLTRYSRVFWGDVWYRLNYKK